MALIVERTNAYIHSPEDLSNHGLTAARFDPIFTAAGLTDERIACRISAALYELAEHRELLTRASKHLWQAYYNHPIE